MTKGPILGINYSGFHDSSAVVVARDGSVVFASSLERLSRKKQDGRPPSKLLDLIQEYSISEIATSTNQYMAADAPQRSALLKSTLPEIRHSSFNHQDAFNDFFDSIGLPVTYVEHQRSHAYSAIGWSGFESGISFTYDGGMCNSVLFGSLDRFGQKDSYEVLDGFDYRIHPKITTMYSLVTALLGFTPNKHEGKITGLAAHGTASNELYEIFQQWFNMNFCQIEQFAQWEFSYSKTISPVLFPNYGLLEELKIATEKFSPEVISSTIQKFTEDHVLEILISAVKKNFFSLEEKICLSGGLFANVRLNQKILNLGFKDVFVAPAMTDDGSALGAALTLVRRDPDYSLHNRPQTVFLGNGYSDKQILNEVNETKLHVSEIDSSDLEFISNRLSEGEIIAIFSGRAEFGPRSLGHRSILASPIEKSINETLNLKLQRTEFMPFAPVIRDVDYCKYFESPISSALPFMTITANATKEFADLCPGVVHLDGTARPQVLSQTSSPFLFNLLTRFYEKTGVPALINTSFNIHEEPIVDSPSDAIRSFLISDIDWLLFENVCLISNKENTMSQSLLLQKEKLNSRNLELNELLKILSMKNWNLEKDLISKESVIQSQIRNAISVRKQTGNSLISSEKLKSYLSSFFEKNS
jgi:carbamoyltransferase